MQAKVSHWHEASVVPAAASLVRTTTLFLFAGLATATQAQTLTPTTSITLAGHLAHPDQLSGVAFAGQLMIVCPDEGVSLNVLQGSVPNRYELMAKIPLLKEEDSEIDMEGATSDGEFVYIVGSHSLHRKTVDEDRTYKKNLERLADVESHDDSFSLFRLKLNDSGKLIAKQRISLNDVLKSDEILKPFCKIASKENGIDIEGLAVKDGRLFVGFRGPVLRGNYVPVMSFRFDHPEKYDLRFVQLGGRGIRDITAVRDGFLVLGGPVGDGEGSYELYFWDGIDCIPGDGSPSGKLVGVGQVPTSAGAKPEGIVVAQEDDGTTWKLLLVCDGKDEAQTFAVPKP